MLRQHNRLPRMARPVVPSLRPHLAPTTARRTCRRPFTQNPPLQTLSPQRGRPQLTYLAPPHIERALPPWPTHLKQHYARLASTASGGQFKKRMSHWVRIFLTVGAMFFCWDVVKFGIVNQEREHKWPTPAEWTWKSRVFLRALEAFQRPEENGQYMTQWPAISAHCRELLHRLEDPNVDGKDIIELEENGFLFESVTKCGHNDPSVVKKSGFDITAKSEQWRQGYYQALLGAAKAAENLEGWMTDVKLNASAPQEYFEGPSNPNPKRATKHGQLSEENAIPASPSPEGFYTKILTTVGFNAGQRVEAAIAFADWLDYKGLKKTAADTYAWAMDIAASGSPVEVSKVVNTKTGVLKNDPQAPPSENIIRVSTAVGVHHARNGNLPTALSIFTSVLKARRALLPPPPGTTLPERPSFVQPSTDSIVTFINTFKSLFTQPEPIQSTPSGNEPPFKTTISPCDEAALMTYIGEIIYASHSKKTGLAWTRDAFDLAETTLPETDTTDPKNKCTQCLRVNMVNWRTMLSEFIETAKKDEDEVREKAKSDSKTSWFSKPSEKTVLQKTHERMRWEAEDFLLRERVGRLGPLVMTEAEMNASTAPGVGLF
ncbi:uncharacterized protein BDV14DRAFT_164108 [Aspergillus stella-maris]|uniref:uncharacterized protein n=1 Tax=Aspergillus stella-maris TaxID=1810926 RepID=UPI003CCCC57C